MRKLINLIGLIVLPFMGAAQLTENEVRQMTQTADEEQLVNESSRMLQEGYFFFSEIAVDRLLQIDSKSANYNYRKGYIVLDSRMDWLAAMPYLITATTSISKNYDMYTAKEKGAPSDAYYHLARCYHLDEQLEKAKEFYNKFIVVSNPKSALVEKAKLRLMQCDVAKYLIEHPKNAIVKNLGPFINTVYPEYSPVVSLDGTSLYFTSRRQWEDQSTDDYRDPLLNQYPEDIYVSTKSLNEDWKKPIRLSFCEPSLNEATVTVSVDERIIYTYEDRTGNGDIYYSDFKNNKFQDLKILEHKDLNTKYWETHCTVTPDGQHMYFVSDRPGGLGGRDIYRSVKLPNGIWNDPINLGPTVNTPFDEDAPFIAVDNKSLYFSSNGNKSMGEFDIFLTIRDTNNVWSNPINLGYPINSTGDDVFYTTTSDGLTGYLSSFRKNGLGDKDIYEIKNDFLGSKGIVVLNGRFITSDESPLPESVYATIKCLNCDDKTPLTLNPRLRDGVFLHGLITCREYEISFNYDAQSPILYSEKFTTECDVDYEEIYRELILDVNRKRVYPLLNYTLDGIVADRKTAEMIQNATVEIYEVETNKLVEVFQTDSKGSFKSSILKDKVFGDVLSYQFKVAKKDYLIQTFDFKCTLGKDTAFHLSYLLEKPEIGVDIAKTLELSPIYFDLNKSNIRPDAKIELDKIVTIMNDNPTIAIELGSHTDCRSSIAYNLALSDRRAKASADYIKARITNPKRIYGKGYGESQLVNDCGCEGEVISNCSEEEHQVNRRTEFRIEKK